MHDRKSTVRRNVRCFLLRRPGVRRAVCVCFISWSLLAALVGGFHFILPWFVAWYGFLVVYLTAFTRVGATVFFRGLFLYQLPQTCPIPEDLDYAYLDPTSVEPSFFIINLTVFTTLRRTVPEI